ncbi:MAG TPA: DUF6412 domain-containing protein, partial [Streptosporangiaceae bacterium]|nr:DUF6412 domain-containing protein [Streptosporangiaceae bacterium]
RCRAGSRGHRAAGEVGLVGQRLQAARLPARTSALWRKSRGAAFQRQLNPDAAGHARPRAPSARPAAA